MEFSELSSQNLKFDKLKKYAPFIIGGLVLGVVAYMSKGKNTTQEIDPAQLAEAVTAPTATANNNDKTEQLLSFFTQGINQIYRQSQTDLKNALNEFRESDATLSKQILDLENDIQKSVVSTSVNTALSNTPATAAQQNIAANVTDVLNSTSLNQSVSGNVSNKISKYETPSKAISNPANSPSNVQTLQKAGVPLTNSQNLVANAIPLAAPQAPSNSTLENTSVNGKSYNDMSAAERKFAGLPVIPK